MNRRTFLSALMSIPLVKRFIGNTQVRSCPSGPEGKQGVDGSFYDGKTIIINSQRMTISSYDGTRYTYHLDITDYNRAHKTVSLDSENGLQSFDDKGRRTYYLEPLA